MRVLSRKQLYEGTYGEVGAFCQSEACRCMVAYAKGIQAYSFECKPVVGKTSSGHG